MDLQFEWDKAKAAANANKHRVTFDEAASVFADSTAKIFWDERHSEDEVREIIIGHSDKNRLLLVSFTEREDRIRIISARRATPIEREDYEENQKN